jgi:putative Mg2+ transporter-C (MgtC) family protein
MIPEFILTSFAFKLLFASFLGAMIGLERDLHGRAAGLRTNLLVSLGAAIFMLLSESIALSHSQALVDSVIRVDPTRIAAQIVTGIGFLGAGAIIKNGLTIRGLTTAACLWISAGIGMSIGAGYYSMGILTTLISLFALTVLSKAERHYKKNAYRILEITIPHKTDLLKVIQLVKRSYIDIMFIEKEKDYKEKTTHLTFTIKVKHKNPTEKVSHEIIADLENSNIEMHKIKWRRQ